MSARNEFDPGNIDYRALTPEQIGRLRDHALENARIERARAIRALFGRLVKHLRRAGAGARAGILTLAAMAASRWAAYQRRRQRRAAAAELHQLSDRDLKDIGLRRSEIDAAVYGYDLDESRRRRPDESPRTELTLHRPSGNVNLPRARREAGAEHPSIKAAA